MKIPTDRQWKVSNSGDIFGNIHACQNINFDNEGYLSLGRRSLALATSATHADLGFIVSIVFLNPYYYVVTDDDIYRFTDPTSVSVVSSTPATSIGSDAVAWQNRMYVSTTSNLSYFDGSSWSANTLCSTTGGKHHPLCVFENKNALAVGNANTVKLIDTSHSLLFTLTIPSDYEVTTMRWRQNNLYIGTKAVDGGEAKMFIWNGNGTEAQSAYGVGSTWIYSMVDYQSSVCLVTHAGQLLRFTGGGFEVKANFPVYYSQYTLSTSFSVGGQVFNRGMAVDGDVVYINIDSSIETLTDNLSPNRILPEMPSGIWCYDPKVGLYCRTLVSNSSYTEYGFTAANSVITLDAASTYETGDPVEITLAGDTGLSLQTYYAIKVTTTTMQLALSPKRAVDGDSITFTNSVSSATIAIKDDTQIGTSDIDAQGAIATVHPDVLFDGLFQTSVIYGADIGTVTSLNIDSVGRNFGTFTTTKLLSNVVTDTFQTIFMKYSGMYMPTDKITVLYRDSDDFELPTPIVAGTYSTSDKIGTGDEELNLSSLQVGFEVVIVSGVGAGYSAIIESINGAEITLDRDIPGAVSTNALSFYVTNFKKMGEVTIESDTHHNKYAKFTFPEIVSKDVTIKVLLDGTNIRIEELEIAQANSLKAV